jgi:hypothetical protein
VRASVPRAQVFLDDGAVGVAPVEREVAPGLHHLRVERVGYASWSAQVELHPGETVTQTALLGELPRQVAPTPFYGRWWFWGAIGAAVVAGTVTAIAVSSGSGSPGGPQIDLSR